MIDLNQQEKVILSELKDFQNATVEQVFQLFNENFTRVLVADEVGLGKTLVARGVIAKTARQHINQKNTLFKVVYVCSNQNIAAQNLNKLNIDKHHVDVGNLSDTRLSMQHLKIYEDEYDPEIQENAIQLIPLTPSTSFKMTLGCGSVKERALIYSVIKQMAFISPILPEFEMMMVDAAYKSWHEWKNEYEKRIAICNEQSHGKYLSIMINKMKIYFQSNPNLVQKIKRVCAIYREYGDRGKREEEQTEVIQTLRKMMAEISIDLIHADLVIMDEFQRFPELIQADSESETAMLANKFFNSSKPDDAQVKILLLSATPYKPYSTLEEIADSGDDEHYKEFMQVTDFLFEKHPKHKVTFHQVWSDYSNALSKATVENFSAILELKEKAENSLYKGIARTERILDEKLSETTSVTSDKEVLSITEGDVTSYMDMNKLIHDVGLTNHVPVDYIKSAPFLMSFMDRYKLKEKMTNAMTTPSLHNVRVKNPLLWLDRKVIAKYGKLRESNARLTKLKEVSLPEGAENLLWMPPSLPYYEFDGYYKGMESFSKVLVFSGWEMVPRSIATLVSYEAERRTVGKLVHQTPKKKRTKTYRYFGNPEQPGSRQRYPNPRLNYAMKENSPANMNHLTLLYPSVTLAKLFNPIDILNRQLTLDELKMEIKHDLTSLLEEIENKLPRQFNNHDARQDERWYYLAPLLFDLNEPTIKNWFNQENLLLQAEEQNKTDESNSSAIEKHFEALKDIFHADSLPALGKQPDDLIEVLTTMVLGSPAICALRLAEITDSALLPNAIHLGKTIIDRFNSQEMTAVVHMKDKDKPHWKSTLLYCVDGNIQAMLDEYAHMLLGERGLNTAETLAQQQNLMNTMAEALMPNSSSLNVDTYDSFKSRVKNQSPEDTSKQMKIRTNYAVGFYDKRNTDPNAKRTNNIRLGFNSPFRPFVLATTSVGQEGLDFHYYCRKIMHWNLPSNPIDIEQRDGRINRYKSYSIRQKIADRYGSISFHRNIWEEMFTEANIHEKNEDTSDLVPFWSLPGSDRKHIERIFPLYPFSRDGAKYNQLMKVLELYRLSLGQPRQGDLLERLNATMDDEQLQKLFMNLSPFSKKVANPIY